MSLLRSADRSDEEFLLSLTARLAEFQIPWWRTAREIDLADHTIIRSALATPKDDTLILVSHDPDGTRTGYIFATTRTDYFTARPHAHIEVVAIVPEAHGRGIGQTLIDAAERWAIDRGYDQMTLNVFEGNTRARTLYDRIGYEPELIHYRKPLGRG